jgi:hypothetical protein
MVVGIDSKQLTERATLIVLVGIKGQKYAVLYAPESPLDLFPGSSYHRCGVARGSHRCR